MELVHVFVYQPRTVSPHDRGPGVMSAANPAGQAWSTEEPEGDRWSVGCLSASAISIAGGTDEVQRNIIGERVLGLPKEPDPHKGAAWETVPRN